MKKYYFLLLIIVIASCTDNNLQKNSNEKFLVDLVNPIIGTTGDHITNYGGMIPAVTMPFGMTQWSAMTRENKISSCSYHYKDNKITGFIGTHQPAIWMGDYGNISLMPQIKTLKVRAAERGLLYSHKDEISHPYYYSVKMIDKNETIKTELTATERCGFFKFSFPEKEQAFISIEMSRIIGFNGYVKIVPEKRQIVGYNSDRQQEFRGNSMGPALKNFKGYFVLQFDTEFSSYGTYSDTSFDFYTTLSDPVIFKQKKELSGEKIGAYVSFPDNKDQIVKVKIASSFISIEQAQENLSQEISDWDFDQVVENTRDSWENYLQRIKIEGGSDDQKVIFYTSMYHSLMYPRIFFEYGKYYSAFDDTVHNGVSYNNYSFWDTHRALHPLLLFIVPERVSPMITSLLQMYDEGGWMPKLPNPSYTNIMIGTHADAVIADAYIKGYRDFDSIKAYQAMYKNAMVPPDGDIGNKWQNRAEWVSYEGRGGLTWYKKYGYIPVDKTFESVSRTLEFAYDDYCVAQMAGALGKNDDYNYFMNRSKNYKILYNKEAGFMQPRFSDGTFFEGNPKKYRAFTEGSPWTYLFCVPHDVEGLVDIMGSKEFFIERLDENFAAGHHRHDNEPGHHHPYLYNYVDQPWKTQEKVREILTWKYTNTPDGLCGNDDLGQMSAWYIFSALGFYPVSPGSDEYALGAPLFEKATIKLNHPNPDKIFTISAKNYSAKNMYVKSIKLDGKKLDKPFIKHSDIINGEILEFEMDSIPKK